MAARTILIAGLAAGFLDIAAAFVIHGSRGVAPGRILQYIASGLLGPAAFQGGLRTMALGAALHFFIALCAAATYYLLTRAMRRMERWPVPSGVLYGSLVYVVMNHVVVPLSAVKARPATAAAVLEGVAIHMLCIGLPIAIVVSFAARRRPEGGENRAG
jgi:hypothetical protein